MNAISGNDVILLPHGSLHTNGHRLLTRVQVTKASNDFLLVQVAGRRFETTNRLHLPIHVEGFIARHREGAGRCIVEVVSLVGL